MRLPITTDFKTSDAAANAPFVVVDGQPILIELQGEIQTDASLNAEDLANQRFGKLDLSNPNKPTLLISHHLLTGTVVNLQTPLAVLRHRFTTTHRLADDAGSDEEEERPTKRKRLLATSSPASDTFAKYADRTPSRPLAKGKTLFPTSESSMPASSSPLRSPAIPLSVRDLQEGRHEIIGLIRKKILFAKRPEPVVQLATESAD